MGNIKEIWKDVLGYEGTYQVSNFGNVKSLSYRRTILEQILKPCLNKDGYYRVTLHQNNKMKISLIHQLVAIAFLNHKRCGYEKVINHKDFNKLNNNIDNLEIVTNRENSNRKHIPSSSKYVGVSWDKDGLKWRAQIKIKGKSIKLGRFLTEIEASNSYQKKLSEITKTNKL